MRVWRHRPKPSECVADRLAAESHAPVEDQIAPLNIGVGIRFENRVTDAEGNSIPVEFRATPRLDGRPCRACPSRPWPLIWRRNVKTEIDSCRRRWLAVLIKVTKMVFRRGPIPWFVRSVDHQRCLEYPTRDTEFVALRAPTDTLSTKDRCQQWSDRLFELAHPLVIAPLARRAGREAKQTRIGLASPMPSLEVEPKLPRATESLRDPLGEDVLLATAAQAAEHADPAIPHSADDDVSPTISPNPPSNNLLLGGARAPFLGGRHACSGERPT